MSNRGCKRPAADRTAGEITREAITVRIKPESADRFRYICSQRKKSQSEILTGWIHSEPTKVGTTKE
jgi:hypothetical protein